MKLARNYWLRWFVGAFITGGAILPLLLLIALGVYLFVSTAAEMYFLPIPITIVSNPFIDIIDPRSGKVIASGYWAIVIMSLFNGIAGGLVGVLIAGLKRIFSKPSHKPLEHD